MIRPIGPAVIARVLLKVTNEATRLDECLKHAELRHAAAGGDVDLVDAPAHSSSPCARARAGAGPAASGRTGYVDEPWHARWIGQPLASRLQTAGYLDWTELDADDVVALVHAEVTS